MGIAASLFYEPNDKDKTTLTKRCSPSDEQINEQQKRWNELAIHLKNDLKNRSGHDIRTWLQGSYKFHTQIRPVRNYEEFDIDLGVYFEWNGSPENGTHNFSKLKRFVQESLESFAAENKQEIEEVAEPKTRCSRIHYKNSFHIDVPGYHLDASQDKRTLLTSNGWESSDPKAIYVWFRDSFNENNRAKIRRQIRYLKTWAALKTMEGEARPSSIMLTVLTAEAALEIGIENFSPDDELLLEILNKIVTRLSNKRDIPNPIAASENLNRLNDDENDKLISAFREFQHIAERANATESQIEASDIWQEAFKHMFPWPKQEVIQEELSRKSRKNHNNLYVPDISIKATARNNPKIIFSGTNSIGPISKGCEIQFEVINTDNVPAGAEFYWTVRNEGIEAELSNDLGHFAGTGIRSSRNSAYRGSHYMDCAVKVAGRIVSLRRVPVDVQGISAPARTPPRRRYV